MLNKLLPPFAPPSTGVKTQTRHSLWGLLWLAIATELLYLFLLAISPLPALHLSSTPLSTSYPWLVQPFQWLTSGLPALKLQFVELPALLFGATLLLLNVLYVLALRSLRAHVDIDTKGSHWLLFLLGSALLFGLTLLLLPRLFSDNVFTYIFAGRTLATYHLDPFRTTPAQIPSDPSYPWILSSRHEASTYAPLWLYLSALITQLSASLAFLLLLFKGLALLTHLLNILLVWSILGRLAPSRRLVGTLLYAWNPLALIELAGNGHNEGLCMFLLLLGTWCLLRARQPRYAAGALLCFGLAVSTNLIALLVLPLYAWFSVDHTRNPWQVALAFTWRLLAMLLPTLLLFLPLWNGANTFFALTSAIDMAHFVHSPAGFLALPLRALFTWFAQLSHMPSYLNPVASADLTVRASATFVFVLIYMRQFGEIRDARLAVRQPLPEQFTREIDPEGQLASIDTLVNGWTITIFWYLSLVSGWFWPWYVLWLFWAVVLRRLDLFSITILMLTATALLLYAFTGFSRDPIATYQTAIIFGLPLVYLLIARIRGRHALE
ncbi:hypothetical protein KSD_20020 [Ktedonobacter sp. SOSP1-85]|uniref:hypothetical protein n=1 Tax=Ktedonobacter sp. SOSP1-85 TaxID=2778367 RepID=UPI00191613ED|nr:hypothetical protein [Ktedonobacter sp. SOSP1-85]GHO74231.1 hypothetical protein KSD_20020 [Ktedonobacter sp. SOSP1-85]